MERFINCLDIVNRCKMIETARKIKVALADDHALLRTALASLINNFDTCSVIIEAGNGEVLIEQLQYGHFPDVLLLDLNMPKMDGLDTAMWLRQHMPDIRVLILTMYDTEQALIRLLKAGVKGFLKKDIHPDELRHAIQSVYHAGYYYSHSATGKIVNLFRKQDDNENISLERSLLTETDIRFLKLTCTELTYKEIAQQMILNPRAVDNLRDSLFQKLSIRSRVGLAMYAMRQGLVTF